MATAYTNYLGSGKRIGQFNLRTTFSIDSRDLNYLVDGNTASSSFWFNTQTVAGKYLEFQIVGSPRVIDKFKIYKASHTGTQSFKFQGYDGSTWTDLTTFDWPTASGGTEFTFTNTTAYRRYRFLGVSGSITNASHYEIEFSTEAANAYEVGNRSGTITVSATGITTSGGNVQNLVDGSETQNTTNSWYPNNNQTVTGSFAIKFALSAVQTFVGAKIRMQAASNGDNGTWKWQGSNDDSTWVDVSEPFVWEYSSSGTLSPVDGFCYFEYPASYAYYRLVGISGHTSNSPWYTEILFDAGPVPSWPAELRVSMDRAGVLSDGAGSELRVSSVRADVLSQGPGSTFKLYSVSAYALISLGPAGELSGDTNAGVYDDITEFGGDDPVEPVLLTAHFADEGVYDAEINVNVGNPFVMRMRDNGEYVAVMTRYLSMHAVDGGVYNAEIGSLPPPPLQFYMMVTGR